MNLPPSFAFAYMSNSDIHSWADAHPNLVNEQDQHGQTLLNVAVSEGYPHPARCPLLVRYLIEERGCNVNGQDRVGRTPIFFGSSPEIFDVLLELGADPIVLETDQGITPLMYHASCGHFATMERLLKDERVFDTIDIQARGSEQKWCRNIHAGFTALHAACICDSRYAKPKDRARIVDLLLTHGANPHLRAAADGSIDLHTSRQLFTPLELLQNRAKNSYLVSHYQDKSEVIAVMEKFLSEYTRTYALWKARHHLDTLQVLVKVAKDAGPTATVEEKLCVCVKKAPLYLQERVQEGGAIPVVCVNTRKDVWPWQEEGKEEKEEEKRLRAVVGYVIGGGLEGEEGKEIEKMAMSSDVFVEFMLMMAGNWDPLFGFRGEE
jgi:hypothetical protein